MKCLSWSAICRFWQHLAHRFEHDFKKHDLADNALLLRGASFQREGQTKEALKIYRSILGRYLSGDATPQAVERFVDLSVAKGQQQTAKEELLKVSDAVEGSALQAVIWRKLGELLRLEGNLREALFYFREAIKLSEEKDAADVQLRIAEVLERQGKTMDAVGEYLKVSYLYPHQKSPAVEGQRRAAALLESIGKTEEAEKINAKLRESDKR